MDGKANEKCSLSLYKLLDSLMSDAGVPSTTLHSSKFRSSKLSSKTVLLSLIRRSRNQVSVRRKRGAARERRIEVVVVRRAAHDLSKIPADVIDEAKIAAGDACDVGRAGEELVVRGVRGSSGRCPLDCRVLAW